MAKVTIIFVVGCIDPLLSSEEQYTVVQKTNYSKSPCHLSLYCRILPCKGKQRQLLTWKVSSYCCLLIGSGRRVWPRIPGGGCRAHPAPGFTAPSDPPARDPGPLWVVDASHHKPLISSTDSSVRIRALYFPIPIILRRHCLDIPRPVRVLKESDNLSLIYFRSSRPHANYDNQLSQLQFKCALVTL